MAPPAPRAVEVAFSVVPGPLAIPLGGSRLLRKHSVLQQKQLMLPDLFSTLAVVGSLAKPPGALSSLLCWLEYTEYLSSGCRSVKSLSTFIEKLEKPDKHQLRMLPLV